MLRTIVATRYVTPLREGGSLPAIVEANDDGLEEIPRICKGGKEAGSLGQLSPSERFHWLVSPRSTIIQPSPVHSGLCNDPEAALHHLLNTMVL